MRKSLSRFWKGESGASTVEFVMVLPLLVLLTVGTIYLTQMMYAASCLHYAVEAAARCLSVNTSTCDSGTAGAYALARYRGPGFTPALTSADFVVTTGMNCGNRVAVTDKPFKLRTGLRTLTVNLSATACFPKLS